jgi:hypothetical protein
MGKLLISRHNWILTTDSSWRCVPASNRRPVEVPIAGLNQPVGGSCHPGTRFVRIPAKEIVYSDLMSIIYRAQRSWLFHVERLIDISQEKCLGRGVVVRSGSGKQHYSVSSIRVDSGCEVALRLRQRRSN